MADYSNISDLVQAGAIKRAAISGSTSGDNTLVAAVTGKKIKVLGLFLISAGTVAVRLENGVAGPALTGVISLTATGSGFVLPISFPHWIETSADTLLNLELGGSVQVSGSIIYYEE